MMYPYKDPALSPKERAKDLLSRLTLREKTGQLNQRLYGFAAYRKNGDRFELSDELKNEAKRWGGIGFIYGLYRADPWSGINFENGICGADAIRVYNEIQRYVMEQSRFDIPALLCEECPHGHQALNGYLLPVNLAIGSAWNPALTQRAFSVCAEQLSALHVDMALISMLDILRDPRWGRSEECYSEDPYLASKMADAAILGMLSHGIDVVAKHCCAQGVTTGGVNASAAVIGERELREIHLPAVRTAVESGAKGIMAAYNEIDGIPCHANKWLLRNVLRGEFGFDGIVMADGRAIDRLNTVASSSEAAAALALRSGVDVSLWDHGFTTLETAVQNGLVDVAAFDQAVLRVLTLKFERGVFENPFIEEKPVKTFDFNSHPQTLELARESVVLLKNEYKTLPLGKQDKSIAVIGPFADDIYAQLGDYTPPQKSGSVMTLLKGMKKISPNGTVINSFAGPFPCQAEAQERYIEKAVEAAKQSDKIIAVLGGSSSRFADMLFADNGAVISKKICDDFINLTDCGEGVDTANIGFPEWQLRLLKALNGLGKPVITVVIAGRPYVTREVSALSDALLWAFYPGPAGGIALAEILWGLISPSGRLSVSLPNDPGQIPAFYNRKASYVSRYSDCADLPKYHFGYGLGYTELEFSGFELSKSKATLSDMEENGLTVSFHIKNTGKIKAFAVPLLFIHDKIASVVPRVRDLKDFIKAEIAPNETVRCELKLDIDNLKVWNSNMEYTAEAGEFELFIYEGDKDRWKGRFELI